MEFKDLLNKLKGRDKNPFYEREYDKVDKYYSDIYMYEHITKQL